MLGNFSKLDAAASAAFEVKLSSALLSFLWDHQVAGSVVFPGAGYVELAAAALSALAAPSSGKAGALTLAAVSIPAPLVLPAQLDDSALPTLVCEISAATGRLFVSSVSAAGGEASTAAKMLHMTCTAAAVQPTRDPVSAVTAPAAGSSLLHQLIPGIAAAAAAAVSSPLLTLGAIASPTEAADGLILHPASLDSCLQLGAVPSDTSAEVVLRVPAGIDLVSLPASSADSIAAVGQRCCLEAAVQQCLRVLCC
jgi:hypothetical protein